MATIGEKIAARKAEIDALFGEVTSAVQAYENVPVVLPSADTSGKSLPEGEQRITTIKVFMDAVDSSGVTVAGTYPARLLNCYPVTPEGAFLAWSNHMETYLAERTGRKRLFWRVSPSLESDTDIETKVTYWNVRSRLGVM